MLVILIEVEGKKINLADLLFALRIHETPIFKETPIFSFRMNYLYSNAPHAKKYYMVTRKSLTDKDWEHSGGLFVHNGSWVPPNYDRGTYLIATKFKNCEY